MREVKKISSLFFCGFMFHLSAFAEEKISFKKDIFPIIKERCYRCHNDKKQKGDLSFASREKALKGGESGAVVILGKSSESILVKLVTSTDTTVQMPPKGKRLSKEEVQKLKNWIDQGLVWEDVVFKEEDDDKKEGEPKKDDDK